jgi:hypothetical protein
LEELRKATKNPVKISDILKEPRKISVSIFVLMEGNEENKRRLSQDIRRPGLNVEKHATSARIFRVWAENQS